MLDMVASVLSGEMQNMRSGRWKEHVSRLFSVFIHRNRVSNHCRMKILIKLLLTSNLSLYSRARKFVIPEKLSWTGERRLK